MQKTVVILFLSLAGLLSLNACSFAPSAHKATGFVEETLLRQMPDPPPVWAVSGSQEEDAEFYYFVGASSKHTEERDAIQEAKVTASNQFVEFCGLDVQIFNE